MRQRAHGIVAVAAFAMFAAIAVPGQAISASDARTGRDKAAPCTTCHGENGISTVPNAPHLAGQPAIYIAEQLRQFRSGRRPSEAMNVIAKPLSDDDIEALAAWYASIRIEATPP